MFLLYPPRIYILFASRPLNGQKKSAPRPPIVQNIIRFVNSAFNLLVAPPQEQQIGSTAKDISFSSEKSSRAEQKEIPLQETSYTLTAKRLFLNHFDN
jgi:hypothetical protein